MIVAELRVPTISNTIKLRTCTSMDIYTEIKSNSLVNDEKNKVKELYPIEWCKNNNYTYKIITEDKLKIMLKNIKDENFVNGFLKKYPKWK